MSSLGYLAIAIAAAVTVSVARGELLLARPVLLVPPALGLVAIAMLLRVEHRTRRRLRALVTERPEIVLAQLPCDEATHRWSVDAIAATRTALLLGTTTLLVGFYAFLAAAVTLEAPLGALELAVGWAAGWFGLFGFLLARGRERALADPARTTVLTRAFVMVGSRIRLFGVEPLAPDTGTERWLTEAALEPGAGKGAPPWVLVLRFLTLYRHRLQPNELRVGVPRGGEAEARRALVALEAIAAEARASEDLARYRARP